jgi:hypothetical protein
MGVPGGLHDAESVRDKGYGKHGDILISMLEYLLMVDISCVHPAEEAMQGRASKQASASPAGRDKAERGQHAKGGTPGCTLVQFNSNTHGKLGVEADNLLKDLATKAASTGVWARDVFLHCIRTVSFSLVR